MSDGFENVDRQNLGEEVSLVVSSFCPFDDELAGFDAVLDPVMSHRCGLKFTHPGRSVCSIGSCRVVTGDEGPHLWVS